ncbi:hypothetical protein [Bradyrhizobium sp. CSS354]|uniref:hypothetical protein n=1 Tax=Bradyrhizobium sp. CSS354 TaxID=2699172 RepID=UPI0023B02B90|nr:hypothetical protein [Bradyrhizobium sp. CSS354]
MAYALFKDDEKLSRTFSTKEETLKKADDAGLVESSGGKPTLEDDLQIKPCSPDPESSKRRRPRLDAGKPGVLIIDLTAFADALDLSIDVGVLRVLRAYFGVARHRRTGCRSSVNPPAAGASCGIAGPPDGGRSSRTATG